MATVTIRDIRLHWPRVERLLRRGPIIVTRDGKPVAKIEAYAATADDRKRFDAVAHMKWLRKQKSSSVPLSELVIDGRKDRV